MGIADRDYMREDDNGNVLPRPSLWERKPRLKGLDEFPEESPLAISFNDDEPTRQFTTRQRWLIGGAGTLIPLAFFALGMDTLLVPSKASTDRERQRSEQVRLANQQHPNQPLPILPEPVIQPRATYTTVEDRGYTQGPLNAAQITGSGTIRLIDMTGTQHYKVLRLRSLYNKDLVGTAVVRPGEDLGIKVPYEHPFRVTAITTSTMPASLNNVVTSTVTVDLGEVTAMPNRPGVVAMGAPDQEMRVIDNNRF